MPFEKEQSKEGEVVHRSAAIQAFIGRLSKLETVEGRRKGLIEFQPRASDIVIATPAKCGTTLVIQICHSLRSRGDMDFDEINALVPCLEMAYDSGVEIDTDQNPWAPRLFKTHSWYHYCQGVGREGVKHIFVMRDPIKAVISFYHFLGNWFFDKEEIGIDTFVQEFVLQRGAPETWMQNASIWDTIASWYPHRLDASVLYLTYENVVRHKRACVEKIACFMGIECDEELMNIAIEQSSKEWMMIHATKYDEHQLKNARNVVCGLDENAGLCEKSTGKIRGDDKSASEDRLSEETLSMLQAKWMDVVYPVTGCTTYDDLRKQLDEELYKNWW